jgi:hypothetical protein
MRRKFQPATFSTTNSVLVRNDLHPAHIILLAQALKETHNNRGLFQQAGEFPTQTDPEFPMAEGAVEFYKNGLPFLDKYLPHWVVPHVLRLFAVLFAGGAIIFPLSHFVPKLYQWFLQDRMRKLYLFASYSPASTPATAAIDHQVRRPGAYRAECQSLCRSIAQSRTR